MKGGDCINIWRNADGMGKGLPPGSGSGIPPSGEIETSVAALIRLSEPIDFDAADGEPVDLVFGMMVPDDISDEDRAEIKRITEVLSDDALRTRLREQNTSGDLYDALIEGDALAEPASAAQGG